MKRFHKIAVTIVIGLLAAPIILYAFYVLTLGPFPTSKEAALAAETETMQTAMNAMMADKNINTVSANDDTTSSLGVNTWTNLPAGPDAAALGGYLKKDTTKFYYCWTHSGEVYPRASHPVGEQPGPCPAPP